MKNTNQSGIAGNVKRFRYVADTTNKKLEWIGHIVRMDRARVVKKLFDCKSEGRRRMGRPKLRWPEDIQKNLQEMKDDARRHYIERSGHL